MSPLLCVLMTSEAVPSTGAASERHAQGSSINESIYQRGQHASPV
jgi:hypothetical protein